MDTAKVFWSGRSQAARLLKAFRFDTDEVRIRRDGARVVLESIEGEWDWLDAVTGPVDADFAAAASDRSEPQDRPELDDLFE
ncbi:AbrB/MazE/SpoVT family DNA-binding domain-containing protein [uncultured Jannaschia sp.]|uniref:antitoxin n=1 Tax=uncultured Jannaschia sp. TaxID=293347 RepID=UPI00261BB8B8|nr:AbrB/MazE/SpoVT family DNA-binding domain-containing protein [uncultured Jannaschia sp.]